MTQTSRPAQPPPVPPAPRGMLCPYCGKISADLRRCDGCRGFFDPLSRQATQNAMGPWFLRDPGSPFRPGCSFETLRDLVRRGRVTESTVLRGPTTRQLWNFAARTPSVANLLGFCHNCRASASERDASCSGCGASFSPETDRQHLGLAPVQLLPGEVAPEVIAAAAMASDTPRVMARNAAEKLPGAGLPELAAPPMQASADAGPIEPAPVPRARATRGAGPAALILLGVAGIAMLVTGFALFARQQGRLGLAGRANATAPAPGPRVEAPAAIVPAKPPVPGIESGPMGAEPATPRLGGGKTVAHDEVGEQRRGGAAAPKSAPAAAGPAWREAVESALRDATADDLELRVRQILAEAGVDEATKAGVMRVVEQRRVQLSLRGTP